MSPTSLATPAPSTSPEPTAPTYNAAFLAGYQAEINRRTSQGGAK